MLICIEIDSTLNFFQYISINSYENALRENLITLKVKLAVWKFPTYHGSREYFQIFTSNVLVLEFFVQKQHPIQEVVGTTPLPAPVIGQENDAREADHRFNTWRQRCFFFCRHVRAVTLVTMQPISDDI